MKHLKPKSEFSRNVLTLMTGTTIAQAIPIAVAPILTRIYTPEDFGLLAFYMSIASIFGVVATLRYELAIAQPIEDEDAVALMLLSTIISFLVSLSLLLAVYIFYEPIQLLLGNKEIGGWLYLMPLSVFLIGLYRSLNYWHTRTKKFSMIAASKVAQSSTSTGVQTGLGAIGIAGGLIWGHLIGSFIALGVLLNSLLKSQNLKFRYINKDLIWRNAKKYKNLPKYSTFGALADTSSLQMPILMMTKYYEMSAVGIFSLTFRVLNLPMSLISQALSQVLFQKVANLHHSEPQRAQLLILKLFFILLAMMIPFVVIIWLFGEELFSFVFGEPWREAGAQASILVVAVAIRFVVSPLSSVLALEHNVKIGVLWQFVYLITITSTLYYFSSWPINDFLTAFVVHEILLYSLYFAFILKGSKYIKET